MNEKGSQSTNWVEATKGCLLLSGEGSRGRSRSTGQSLWSQAAFSFPETGLEPLLEKSVRLGKSPKNLGIPAGLW